MQNPYLELTEAFNRGRLRALLSSGQAVVVHRLAITSKDGDWILREDDEATAHVRTVLGDRGARYRFGAPLDVRWLAGGWSAHFEYRSEATRIRTDFVSRPPRISPALLAAMWRDAEERADPVVGLEPLAAIKLTNREKDYAVVGELARRMAEPRSQLRWSRSSRDLIGLADAHPDLVAQLVAERALLARIPEGRDVLDAALDAERRVLMRVNEDRLTLYRRASERWEAAWPDVSREIEGLPLDRAHAVVVERAERVLPFAPDAGARP